MPDVGSVDVSRAGLAGGVNNAAARVAGLVAVAALPVLTGTGADAYQGADAFNSSLQKAMPICAGVLVVGAVPAFSFVRCPAPGCRRPECRTHGALTAPPLEGRAVRKGAP